MNMPHSHFDQELDARVTRLGLRLAAGLTEHNERLSPDISTRLQFAREQALAKAKAARAVQPVLATSTNSVPVGASLALRGGADHSTRWFKLFSLMPLLILVLGLFLIQHSQWYQQIQAAAEVDTALLSKPLPPAAYSDPGFNEFLSEEHE